MTNPKIWKSLEVFEKKPSYIRAAHRGTKRLVEIATEGHPEK